MIDGSWRIGASRACGPHARLLRDSTHAQVRPVLAHYTRLLIDQGLLMMATATLVVYARYTFSAPNTSDNPWMMLSIRPFSSVLRYLYLVYVAGLGGEPDQLIVLDRPRAIGTLVWVASAAVAVYVI